MSCLRLTHPARASALAALAAAVTIAACHAGRPHSPEAAFHRLIAAAAQRNVSTLYDLIDQHTRWSVEGAYTYEHEMASIVDGSYPPGAERERALRELGPALGAASGREMFVRDSALHDPWGQLARLATERAGGERVEMLAPDPRDPRARAVVHTRSGAALPFSENDDGTWGYSGFSGEWQARMVRDSHDVLTYRENGRLYRTAGAAATGATATAGGQP